MWQRSVGLWGFLVGMSACIPVPLDQLVEGSETPAITALPSTETPATPEVPTPTPRDPEATATPSDTTPPQETPLLETPTLDPNSGTVSPDPEQTATPEATASPTPTALPDPDSDGDGFSANTGDCDDTNAAIKPGATERCNGLDDNCNDAIDEGLTVSSWYQDADSDGDGNTSSTTTGCAAPSGYVGNALDCNDNDSSIYSGATEVCNAQDDDCDGQPDDGLPTQLYYPDADEDGYGINLNTVSSCRPLNGYSSVAGDCDDQAEAINPGAEEVCNQLDDDCSLVVDDGGIGSTWYADGDGDSFGSTSITLQACDAPEDYVDTTGDCNDENASIHPTASEICNALDDNCNGSTDEGAIGGTWYQDADGDSFGSSVSMLACTQPSGFVSNNSDCDDGNGTINPSASEVQNGVDDNCDGVVDIPSSCQAILQAFPNSNSGKYVIDPDGSGSKSAFSVYCDMKTNGGGWTLLAVFSNNDGSKSWTPRSDYWVNDSKTIGTGDEPSLNQDAKSRAFGELNIDRLMIVKAPGTVEILTSTSCVQNHPLSWVFKRDSATGSSCAMSCGLTTVSGYWTGDSCQANQLNFRCMDGDYASTYNGYKVGGSDNSFITTNKNTSGCEDYTFGMGSSEYYYSSTSDYTGYFADYPNESDKTQRLLFGR